MIAVATAYHYAGQATMRRDDRPIWYIRVDCNRRGEVGWSFISPVSSSAGSGKLSATTVSFFAATKDATSFPLIRLSGHDN